SVRRVSDAGNNSGQGWLGLLRVFMMDSAFGSGDAGLLFRRLIWGRTLFLSIFSCFRRILHVSAIQTHLRSKPHAIGGKSLTVLICLDDHAVPYFHVG